MQYCDLKAPLDPEFNPKTTYEDAAATIIEALQVMGPEYTAIMKEGISNRWINDPIMPVKQMEHFVPVHMVFIHIS